MDETGRKWTRNADKLIELYNKHNKARLERNNLICWTCESWLTSPIYLLENGEHVCENCKPTTQVPLRNKSLETLLKGTEYPCINNVLGCDVITASIVDHENICDYMFCPCKPMYKHINFDHGRSVHSMKHIPLKKPVAEIILEPDNPMYQQFQLCTIMIDIWVNVWPTHASKQIYLFPFIGSFQSLKYTIAFTHDNIKYMQSGQMYDNKVTLVTIPKLDAEYFPNSFKIYFEDYEKLEPFESYFEKMMKDCKCPICLEVITDVCYQCVNGHNICAKCKEKTTTCPACQMEINSTAVNICCMPRNFKRLCKNVEFGCFVYGDNDGMKQHETKCDSDIFE